MIRVLRTEPDHLPAIREMLEEEIAYHSAHFSTTIPTDDELREEFEGSAQTHPWLTALYPDGSVVGFARATPYKKRDAYHWCAEVSVYVRRDLLGEGIGTGLLERLLRVMRRQGFAVAMAHVAVPNDGAVALIDRLEFERTGVLPDIGFKNGKWRTVEIWMKRLSPADRPPPRQLADIELSMH